MAIVPIAQAIPFSFASNMTLSTPSVREATEAETTAARGETGRDAERGLSGRVRSDKSGNVAARASRFKATDKTRGGQRQPAAGEAVPQPGLGAGEPAGKRSLRDAQPPRGLLARQALELAEDERPSIPRGQACQLLVENRPQLVCETAGRSASTCCGLLTCASLARRRAARTASLVGSAVRDPVQPARHLLAPHDRRRLPRQDQERRLEGVLGVVHVPQESARQTPKTIGPWRRTSAANASSAVSSPRAMNCSSNCSSLTLAHHAATIQGPQVSDDLARDPPRIGLSPRAHSSSGV